ncbi:hypothetical protein [Actinoplanes sp. L3-i22]|uniref:hypothetical protein n=1 Tax=Actinoplanes sp. L3-i22 TaxID=2836373 RepID=UPI001C749A3A|nr:hypothetical protein [Actinoplanes sp. L3-i22]BCY15298.1 hypothetical protein L3i22_103860 [Actinoplanes sp. L3-i22]
MDIRRIGQFVVYCSGLGLVSAASLGLAVTGRPAAAARLSTAWQSRIGPPPDLPGRVLPAAANAAVGLLLGLFALIPLGFELIFPIRGLGYGWVDPGPYDTAWGGPGLAGAWTAHAVIGAALAVAGLFMMAGLAALHRRWTARLAGAPGGAWVLPVVILSGAAGALFFIGWLRQI